MNKVLEAEIIHHYMAMFKAIRSSIVSDNSKSIFEKEYLVDTLVINNTELHLFGCEFELPGTNQSINIRFAKIPSEVEEIASTINLIGDSEVAYGVYYARHNGHHILDSCSISILADTWFPTNTLMQSFFLNSIEQIRLSGLTQGKLKSKNNHVITSFLNDVFNQSPQK